MTTRRYLYFSPFFLVLTAFFQSIFTTPAAARVYVDITSAQLHKVPIAVPYFIDKSHPDQKSKLGKEMSSLLSRALDFHGFVDILPAEAYDGSQNMDWTDIGADYTILGNFENDAEGIALELRLIDAYKGYMTLGRRYKGPVSRHDLMVKKFCDEVVEKLTGEPGISLSKIAFVSDKTGQKEIYVSDVFGENVRQVTNHRHLAVSPRFSPDGKKLAYTSYHKNNPNLYITDLSQSKTTKLVSRRQGLNMAPAWSPDGRTMAITLSIDDNPDLYLIDIAGEIIERLTKNAGINVSPTWSPDGKELAFVSDRSGSPQIYVMTMKNKSVSRITYSGSYNSTPSWSPKGDWIAYSSKNDGNYHIIIIRPDGDSPTKITSTPGDHESPSWSPDGKQILFSRKINNKQQIYAINRNGTGMRALFANFGDQTFPQWSPRIKE